MCIEVGVAVASPSAAAAAFPARCKIAGYKNVLLASGFAKLNRIAGNRSATVIFLSRSINSHSLLSRARVDRLPPPRRPCARVSAGERAYRLSYKFVMCGKEEEEEEKVQVLPGC